MFEKTTKEYIMIEKNNNNINTKIRSYINRLTFFYNYVEAAALYSSKWLQKCKQLATITGLVDLSRTFLTGKSVYMHTSLIKDWCNLPVSRQVKLRRCLIGSKSSSWCVQVKHFYSSQVFFNWLLVSVAVVLV